MAISTYQALGAAAAITPLLGVGCYVGHIFNTLVAQTGRNPSARDKIFGIGILGFAITESIALLAVLISFLILYSPLLDFQAYGSALAISLPLLSVGYAISRIFTTVITNTARNPAIRDKIFGIGILGFAITEAVALLAVLVAFLILYTPLADYQAYGAALAIIVPLASVGHGVGKIFQTLINAVSLNPGARDKLFGIGILGFAITESIALLAVLIAFLILYTPLEAHQAYGAALAVALPLGAVGYAIGKLFQVLIESVALNPLAKDKMFGIGILGFAITEAVALLAVLIAFLILYT